MSHWGSVQLKRLPSVQLQSANKASNDQWSSKIKITIFFHWIGLHFDFMNPIKQAYVLTKTFETMIGLAGNIILWACQWYSGSKICCLKSWCLLFSTVESLLTPFHQLFKRPHWDKNFSWQLWLSIRLLTDKAKCSWQIFLINNFLSSKWNLLCVTKVVNQKLWKNCCRQKKRIDLFSLFRRENSSMRFSDLPLSHRQHKIWVCGYVSKQSLITKSCW